MPGHFLDWLDAADPSRIALVDDERAVTYGQLRDEAQVVASGLTRRFGTGRFLLLPAERTVGFVRLLCAIAYSGNVAVPIDPLAPEALISQLAEPCGDWALVTVDEAEAHRGPGLDRRDAALPALVLFTSGTSGVPKGVVVSQSNLAHSVQAIGAYLNYQDYPSAAIVLPLHYSYALLSQLFCMFAVGGRSRLFASLRNPLKFARAVNELELQTFCGVPTTYQALCTMRRLTPISMPAVRVICSAGAAMDRGLLPEIRQIFPSAVFFDNYGMTEATPRVSFIRDDDPIFGEPTCGQPIAGLEIRVLDEVTLATLPDGEQGIIAVRGPNVFAGYLNDPKATAAAFTSDGLLLSADLGYLKCGYLYVVGRRDDVFNVGGEKVAPLEIERVLATHANVEACAISGLEDAQRGMVAAAYIKLRQPTLRRVLVEFLSSRLPAAKVPSRYFEVTEFPMTANGKLQRSRLSPNDSSLAVREIT